jgi:hypothetical protein
VKDSILFKKLVIIPAMMIMVIFSSCKKDDSSFIISESQKTELEEFLSIFTVKPVLSEYTKGKEESLLYFTLYHLLELDDDRVRFDERNNEYIVPKLAVEEKIEQYFGVNGDFSQYLGTNIRLENDEYHFDNYFQSGGGYAKIESISKEGDDLFLTCYTTDSNGKRHKSATEFTNGGPTIYNFTALVAPHEYSGEKTWKLVEFQQIE